MPLCQRLRSQGHIAYEHKKCSNSILGGKFRSHNPIFEEKNRQWSRSHRHIMYTQTCASTQYQVVLSSSYSGSNMRTTPKRVGHKMDGDAGCQATGSQIFDFMAAQLKKMQISVCMKTAVYLRRCLCHAAQFFPVHRSKDRVTMAQIYCKLP